MKKFIVIGGIFLVAVCTFGKDPRVAKAFPQRWKSSFQAARFSGIGEEKPVLAYIVNTNMNTYLTINTNLFEGGFFSAWINRHFVPFKICIGSEESEKFVQKFHTKEDSELVLICYKNPDFFEKIDTESWDISSVTNAVTRAHNSLKERAKNIPYVDFKLEMYRTKTNGGCGCHGKDTNVKIKQSQRPSRKASSSERILPVARGRD